jgi:MobA/MobL family
MAIYRLQIESISRGDGHSSVGAAAYRAGERLRDDRTNEVYNHSRRKDVTHSEIMLPSELSGGQNMEWAKNRSSLWNSVENAESRKNARVAREIQVNLPHELPPERRVALARAFSQEVADHYKVAVDLAVHEPRPSGDPRNYHAHLLMTTREVSPEGLGAKAGLELSRHERMRLGLPSSSQEFTAIRARWATVTNEALKEANIEARVDHRSLAEQGIDREPRPHIPFAAYKIERAGHHSDVAESIRADYAARVQARLERQATREPAPALQQANAPAPQQPNAPAPRQANAPAPEQPNALAPQQLNAPARQQPNALARQQANAPAPEQPNALAPQQLNAPARQQPNALAPQQPNAPAQADALAPQLPGAQAPQLPAAQPPRSLEEIRREARENWLKLRAAAQQAAPAAPGPSQELSGHNQPAPGRGLSAASDLRAAPGREPGAANERPLASPQHPAASTTPTRAPDNDQTL